jgi:hypothetical protein
MLRSIGVFEPVFLGHTEHAEILTNGVRNDL